MLPISSRWSIFIPYAVEIGGYYDEKYEFVHVPFGIDGWTNGWSSGVHWSNGMQLIEYIFYPF